MLAVASRSALAVADAGEDAAPDVVGTAYSDVTDAIEEGREELTSLIAFTGGRLGPKRSAELFRVDLANEQAVRKRRSELEKDVSVARRAAKGITRPPVADATPDGAGVGEGGVERSIAWLLDGGATTDAIVHLRLEVLEERLRILSLPQKERAGLLAAEQDAIRAEAARREAVEAEREAEQAEEERLKALQAAQEARTNVERRLAEVRARVEAVRSEQLRARARAAEQKHAFESAAIERAEALAVLSRAVSDVSAGSVDADALYDRVVSTLIVLRARATSLLDAIDLASSAPRLKDPIDLPDTSSAELEAERERLSEAVKALARDASTLEADERGAAWSALRSVITTEGEVNELRMRLLDRVSADKRGRVLGFGEEGRAQGAREIARIRLELRWLRATGREVVRETLASLKRPAAIARISAQLLTVVALVWAAMVVRRRHASWLRWMRAAAARSIRSPSALRALQRGSAALEAVGRESVTLGAVLLAGAFPWLDVRTGALRVLYVVLLWYWIYRLALGATYHGVAWAAGRSVSTGRENLSEKILRSVRIVGRTAFSVAVLLASSAAVVGTGYLHGLVVRLAWVLAFAIGAILVRIWREDIAEAYLGIRPNGSLSRLVARTRTSFVGFFVVTAAFGFVLASGIVRAARRFVLGFEHSRKALAYLFRRRLEKQVEHAPTARPMLAPDALRFFAEGAVDDDELAIERYPGLAELEERYLRWKSGERVGATLVVGRTGYGKTSWLRSARSRLAEDAASVVFRERATTPADVVAALGAALAAPPGTGDADALVEFLRRRGRRVVTVDEAHLLFLRGMDRLEGWRTFSRIVDRTCDRVLWVVAFAHYSWELLEWIAKGDHVFRTVVRLAPWSEGEIAELLRRRTEASGLDIVYDDLLMDTGLDNPSSRILTTARDYDRLIWDYAEGSPRVALHVWGRSLVPDGERRARVRLFANPDAAILESLTETSRFVLAAIVWHERLSVSEAVAVTIVAPAQCEDALARFGEAGIIEVVAGRFRITARWWPLVVRYLRRKHLIET